MSLHRTRPTWLQQFNLTLAQAHDGARGIQMLDGRFTIGLRTQHAGKRFSGAGAILHSQLHTVDSVEHGRSPG